MPPKWLSTKAGFIMRPRLERYLREAR